MAQFNKWPVFLVLTSMFLIPGREVLVKNVVDYLVFEAFGAGRRGLNELGLLRCHSCGACSCDYVQSGSWMLCDRLRARLLLSKRRVFSLLDLFQYFFGVLANIRLFLHFCHYFRVSLLLESFQVLLLARGGRI